jgi:hypothetical protein
VSNPSIEYKRVSFGLYIAILGVFMGIASVILQVLNSIGRFDFSTLNTYLDKQGVFISSMSWIYSWFNLADVLNGLVSSSIWFVAGFGARYFIDKNRTAYIKYDQSVDM